ncbi:MAG: hypothetical protein GY844_21700 [Bradyrhizobium sp.]|nr:hypothetical protein [Bradyrhizobium sp.]
MSQRSRWKSQAIFGALAAIATLGAVQIAASAAAPSPTLADRFQALGEPAAAAGINRAAKGDRAANVPQASEPARTVLLKVDSIADTSVLVRIPVQKEARHLSPAQPAARPAGEKAKRIVACEPVVSVLTEVAKLLQPGKCVT